MSDSPSVNNLSLREYSVIVFCVFVLTRYQVYLQLEIREVSPEGHYRLFAYHCTAKYRNDCTARYRFDMQLVLILNKHTSNVVCTLYLSASYLIADAELGLRICINRSMHV